MRLIDIRERSIPISRYRDVSLPSGGLTTSIVAVITDIIRGGRPVVGYGFASIGRFAQSGLIRDRFGPRLLKAREEDLRDPSADNFDPFRAWQVMMAGEKPGGHGERCVAVGALDMAIWDAAAKIASLPVYRYLAQRVGRATNSSQTVRVYAGGGYYYPRDDIARLSDEVRQFRALGYTDVKIKIGGVPLGQDLRRIEAVARLLPDADRLAVDAMNTYNPSDSMVAASELLRYGLRWFEDICDPLDFETLAAVAPLYPGAIGAGEALFSAAEAKLLDCHAGLRRDRDILLFDPVHCYGVPGYLQIVDQLTRRGWPRAAFWPHGGHLFCLHVVAALGLGGAECNPLCFDPFGGYTDDTNVSNGTARPPDVAGIGFEARRELHNLLGTLLGT